MIEEEFFNYFFEARPNTPLFSETIRDDIRIYSDILEFLFSPSEIHFDPRRASWRFYVISTFQQLIDIYLAKLEEIPQVYEDYCTPYPTSTKVQKILHIWLNPMSIR